MEDSSKDEWFKALSGDTDAFCRIFSPVIATREIGIGKLEVLPTNKDGFKKPPD